MLAILLSVLGIGGAGALALWLIGPARILAFVQSVPWQVWALVGVVAGLLFLWHLHSNQVRNAHDRAFNEGFNIEWKAHQADIAKWRKASIKAEADQRAVNERPAIVSGEIASKSNEQAKIYYDEGYRAAAAYAAAHRVPVRQASALGNQGGEADLPRADPPVQGADGPRAASDVASGLNAGPVTLSQPDFDLLVGNSLRLARVHQDVQALIDAGIAVSSGP